MRLEVHVQATSEMGRQIRPSIVSCDEEPKIVGEAVGSHCQEKLLASHE